MHHRRSVDREAEREGRVVCAELCGQIPGFEHGGAEAFGDDEGQRDVGDTMFLLERGKAVWRGTSWSGYPEAKTTWGA